MEIVDQKPLSARPTYNVGMDARVCDACHDKKQCLWPIKHVGGVEKLVALTKQCRRCKSSGTPCTIDGCPAGNCLRSHVNLTETTSALAMSMLQSPHSYSHPFTQKQSNVFAAVTKAGVPSNKIYVGESSYGRSFKMAKAGCSGPMCTFLGDRLNSQAKKGRCTGTSGYISNAEIEEIIAG